AAIRFHRVSMMGARYQGMFLQRTLHTDGGTLTADIDLRQVDWHAATGSPWGDTSGAYRNCLWVNGTGELHLDEVYADRSATGGGTSVVLNGITPDSGDV